MSEHDEVPNDEKFTGMDFLKNVPGIETFKSKFGTTYATIAKKNGLVLAIAPKIHPAYGLVLMTVRVRVQKAEDWANLSDASSLFGFNVKEREANHSSIDVNIPVARMPVTPYDTGKIVSENKLVEKIVGHIYETMTKAKAEPQITEVVAVEYLKNVFTDALPTDTLKQLEAEDFTVVVGEEATIKAIHALNEKYDK